MPRERSKIHPGRQVPMPSRLGMSPLSRLQILSYSYSLGTQIASISCQLSSFGCERSNVLRKKPTKSQGTSSILRYVYIYLFANFVVEIIY